MDKKDPPRFEYTHNNSNESDEQRLHSSDFWASRGNMGEKINILIGLNLLLINLVSTYILRKEDTLPNDLFLSLNKTQELLYHWSSCIDSNRYHDMDNVPVFHVV